MNIEIKWEEPVLIAQRGNIVRDFNDDFEYVPDVAGVYFFSRSWGNEFQPFYIGKANNIRSRLRNHLKSRKIYEALKGYQGQEEYIKQGDKFFHFGVLKSKQGQKIEKCLKIAEKYLIQVAYNDMNFILLNVKLKELKGHELLLSGSISGRGPFDRSSFVVSG